MDHRTAETTNCDTDHQRFRYVITQHGSTVLVQRMQ
jgi:hypothetical protein